MNFTVTILGSNSAVPAHFRHPSAQLISYHDTSLLFDCGEGTQMRMLQHGVKRNRLEHILISHLHGDHYFGLIGLLTSLNLLGHNRAIHLYAHAALKGIIDLQLAASNLQLRLPLYFHELPIDQPAIIIDEPDFEVEAIPLEHRIPCCGFIIREKEKPRKLDARAAKRAGIPHTAFAALKDGKDYHFPDGRIVSNDTVTWPPPPSYSYAYITDTLALDRWDDRLMGVDVLYHEATFLHEALEKANSTYHSTAAQAALIAKRVHAGKLLIGHFSAKYKDLLPLLEEAQAIFPATDLAIEGTTFQIGE